MTLESTGKFNMTPEERQKWIDEHPIRKMVINMYSEEAEKKKLRAKELQEQENLGNE